MQYSSESINKVIDLFASLPSIGRKTAQRLTYHILRQPPEYVDKFANSMVSMMQHVKFCSVCLNYTEQDPCPICSSHKRQNNVICVVEDPNDVLAIERTNEFYGLYHVLHGILNPLDGIGPEDIKIKELLSRLNNIDEVILAINPSVEGEVTMQYISKMIKTLDIKVSRLASGLPMGGAIEYSDEATLSKALESRIFI